MTVIDGNEALVRDPYRPLKEIRKNLFNIENITNELRTFDFFVKIFIMRLYLTEINAL